MSEELLVPLAVEGLVVNTAVRAESHFLRWHASYDAMQSLTDPMPDPWQNKDKDPPPIGIHLRWNLPRALKHGEINDDRQVVEFPHIPNRWLIVRLGAATPSGESTARPTKAWIVESDYAGSDGTNSFAVKQGTEVVFTRIGRSYELSAAPHLFHSSNAPGFLTAVGAGDVTFTAYQPDMQNVLSFHDPATGVAEGTSLTYLIAGWFANTSDDPMTGVTTLDELKKRLDVRRWSLNAGTTIPSRTIVHGLLQEVTWQTAAQPKRKDPDASQMSVAVGHTAIDALAALVAKLSGTQEGAKLEQRLQAFQYDMFDVLDEHGAAALEVNIRRGWFSQTPGGTMWNLAPVTDNDPNAKTPVPTDAQRQWLAKLNREQQKLDEARRMLRSLQAELYELWWKKARIEAMTDVEKLAQKRPPNKLEIDKLHDKIADLLASDNPEGIASRVKKQAELVATFKALPDPSKPTSIRTYEQSMPEPRARFQLKPATEPPFQAPVDPVVLVAGITPPAGTLESGERVPCRITSQTVTGVKSGGVTFDEKTGTIANVMPRIDLSKLPEDLRAAIGALLREAFFVDPTDAPSIVWAGKGSRDSTALAVAMRDRTAQMATIPAPLAAAYAFAKWEQAWSPLHLVWQVKWYANVGDPTGPQGTNDWRGAGFDTFPLDMTRWSFDGRDDVRARGSEYYAWNGTEPAAQKMYTGRSLLTPQTTLLFIDRLKSYLEQHRDADLEKIRKTIDAVGATHFLSQSLALNEKIVARRHQHTRVPDDIAALIGAESETIPDVAVGDQRPCAAPPCSTLAFFFPVRGGYFTIEQLLLVDAYGQYVDLIQAQGNTDGGAHPFYPVRGQGLAPDAGAQLDRPQRFVKLAPRIVQPSRLQMRLIDANDDSRDVGLYETANPICGWVVHNFLDRSLAFYSPDGIAIGDLMLTGNANQSDVVWIATPRMRDASGSVIVPPSLSPRAQSFRDQLLARSDRGAAFRALLTVIDERVGTIDHGTDSGDPDLAVLVGRPLALVRARAELQLFGLPAANTSWRSTQVGVTGGRASWDSNARQTANVTSTPIPIRLGTEELTSDGVIGYLDADDKTFNSVRAPRQATPYIRPIGNGNYINLKFAGETSRSLTLLIDPRVKVHATTGILPTASLSIPAELVDPALKRMAFTFRTGPILSARDSIRIPRPAEQHGDWLWLRRTGDARSIIDVTEDPKLEERVRALDGWLKFTP
ncbi:MAG: hypothetical protein ACJ74H_11810 [Thermoanaerobaculia bacterium]